MARDRKLSSMATQIDVSRSGRLTVTGQESDVEIYDTDDSHSHISATGEFAHHLNARVFFWISQNPGMDAKDVSAHFGISGQDAVSITEGLLAEGLLDFDE